MTKRKLAVIIISAIIAAVLLTVAVCAIVANSKNDKTLPTRELSQWQSMIKDDVLLKNTVIAGAHDAGTKGLPYFAATQDRDIAGLLNCGTRYLDLRVAYAESKLLIYHGPSKGTSLSSVLEQVREFVTDNNTECVLLDFQHFDEKELEAQNDVIKLVENTMLDLLVTNNGGKTDSDYVDGLTIGDVRGKCLILWGRETEYILSKNYVFKRNNDDGTRADSTLHSYYTGSLNKKSSRSYIKTALPTYIGKYKTKNKGLFVLQGQLTDGLYVFGPKFREATHTDNMNNYLDGLKESSDLQYINIVIRDFITPSKNCHTLQLNLNKGTVKEEMIRAFDKMILDNIG